MKPLTRTWIDTKLTTHERGRLVDWLLERSHNPTGELIRTGIIELGLASEEQGTKNEELPDAPSVQSCLTWRAKAWSFELHLRELRAESEAAKILADASGNHIVDANEKLTQSYLFEQLRALKEGADVDREAIHHWITSAARLTKATDDRRKLELDRDKFEVTTCELFLKWFGEKQAKNIAESNLSNSDKIAALRQAYFSDVDEFEASGIVEVPE